MKKSTIILVFALLGAMLAALGIIETWLNPELAALGSPKAAITMYIGAGLFVALIVGPIIARERYRQRQR